MKWIWFPKVELQILQVIPIKRVVLDLRKLQCIQGVRWRKGCHSSGRDGLHTPSLALFFPSVAFQVSRPRPAVNMPWKLILLLFTPCQAANLLFCVLSEIPGPFKERPRSFQRSFCCWKDNEYGISYEYIASSHLKRAKLLDSST